MLYELDFEVPALLLRALASGQARDHPSPAARRAAGIRRAMAFLEEHRQWSPRQGNGPLELFYTGTGQMLFSVTLTPGPPLRLSQPQPLTAVTEALRGQMSATPLGDGRWLALVRGEEEEPATELRVVLNWTERLDAATGTSSAGE